MSGVESLNIFEENCARGKTRGYKWQIHAESDVVTGQQQIWQSTQQAVSAVLHLRQPVVSTHSGVLVIEINPPPCGCRVEKCGDSCRKKMGDGESSFLTGVCEGHSDIHAEVANKGGKGPEKWEGDSGTCDWQYSVVCKSMGEKLQAVLHVSASG